MLTRIARDARVSPGTQGVGAGRTHKVETVDGSLRDLLTDVVRARGALHHERRQRPAARLDLGLAQHRLVVALQAYEHALHRDGAPMPYRLRDELRLLQSLDRLNVAN